jgi:hypothetical protein
MAFGGAAAFAGHSPFCLRARRNFSPPNPGVIAPTNVSHPCSQQALDLSCAGTTGTTGLKDTVWIDLLGLRVHSLINRRTSFRDWMMSISGVFKEPESLNSDAQGYVQGLLAIKVFWRSAVKS